MGAVRPDNDTPQFHLTAEARSLPAAQELVADYGGLVRRYVQEPCSNGEPSNGRREHLA